MNGRVKGLEAMPQNNQKRGKRKQRTGVVISCEMQKTIVVRAVHRVRHPVYGKEMKISQKMYAHDEKRAAKTGDKVLIMETRPLSRLKRWRLVRVLQSGAVLPRQRGAEASGPETAPAGGDQKSEVENIKT